MLALREHFPECQFVLAGVDNLGGDFYSKVISSDQPTIIYDETYAILQHSDAALVASGTATLETALLKIPQVVCYDIGGGKFLYNIYEKFMLNVKYVSLVNLVMDRLIVKEFLQHHFSVENLTEELQLLLNDKAYRKKMLDGYDNIINELGGEGASEKTAQSIINILK